MSFVQVHIRPVMRASAVRSRRGAFFVHCQGTKASGHFNTMTPAGTNKSITFTRVFIPTSKRRVMTHDTVSIVIIYHLPRVEGYTARWPRIAPANPIHQFVARILLPPESPEAGWSLASASQKEAGKIDQRGRPIFRRASRSLYILYIEE